MNDAALDDDENSAHDTTQITGPSKAVARKKKPGDPGFEKR
ncbi:hypothetical protein RKK42_10440 [Klebsiella pneumoniae]|nr:hypothetical protein [Klebsiella pneumoniae]